MGAKERFDTDTKVAEEIVRMEEMQEESVELERTNYERMYAETHQMIGQIRTADMFGKFANVSSLVWLQQVKESKIYKDIPEVGTWEKFCDSVGLQRQKVDLDLRNLATFGEEFLITCQQFSLSYRDLRKLRQLSHDGTITIDADAIEIDGERILLNPDNKEDLQAAIESLLENKDQVIEEQQAEIRGKDRSLEAQQITLNKQEKELIRHEARASSMGLSAGEEEFFKQNDAARITIDGFMQQFDPEYCPLPEEATPRMIAKYMETLCYFKRVMDSTYETASDTYGAADMDGFDWTPPNMRGNADQGDKD